jgi:hypothetical protein
VSKTYVGNKTPSSAGGVGKVISMCRRLKLVPYLSSCTKVNSTWFKNFNITPESLKLLLENRRTLEDLGIGKNFLSKTLIAQEIKQELTSRAVLS